MNVLNQYKSYKIYLAKRAIIVLICMLLSLSALCGAEIMLYNLTIQDITTTVMIPDNEYLEDTDNTIYIDIDDNKVYYTIDDEWVVYSDDEYMVEQLRIRAQTNTIYCNVLYRSPSIIDLGGVVIDWQYYAMIKILAIICLTVIYILYINNTKQTLEYLCNYDINSNIENYNNDDIMKIKKYQHLVIINDKKLLKIAKNEILNYNYTDNNSYRNTEKIINKYKTKNEKGKKQV